MSGGTRPRILINGISARYGGGRVILDGLLSSISRLEESRYRYVVITAGCSSEYDWVDHEHIKILEVPSWMKRTVFQTFFYLVFFPRLISRNRISVILNLADITVRSRIPQVYFFDWAYLVYPRSVVWRRMRTADFLFRRIKARLILNQIRHVDLIIAQTDLMGSRLRRLLGRARICTIPTPVQKTDSGPDLDFNLPGKRFKLICLTNYAPHKNVEILVEVAKELRHRKAICTIITTLDDRSPPVHSMLTAIEAEGLSEWLLNIGRVESRAVHALLSQGNALLLPTLLESYGLPYFEAMAAGIPIITSDLDFAKAACGEAAFYFDPFSSTSIADAITEAADDPADCIRKTALGSKILEQIPEWGEFTARIERIFDNVHTNASLHGTIDD